MLGFSRNRRLRGLGVAKGQRQQPTASEVQPLLLDLEDRGIISILDIAILIRDPDGSVAGVELGEFQQVAAPAPSSRARPRACWFDRLMEVHPRSPHLGQGQRRGAGRGAAGWATPITGVPTDGRPGMWSRSGRNVAARAQITNVQGDDSQRPRTGSRG